MVDTPLSPHLDTLLGRLEEVRQKDVSEGRSSIWVARCPNPSHDSPVALQVGLGPRGEIVVMCGAGCGIQEILQPLGLRPSDLQPVLLQDSGRAAVAKSRPGLSAPKPATMSERPAGGNSAVTSPPDAIEDASHAGDADSGPAANLPSAAPSALAQTEFLYDGDVRRAIAHEVPILLCPSADDAAAARAYLHGSDSSHHHFCPTAPRAGWTAWTASHRNALTGAHVLLLSDGIPQPIVHEVLAGLRSLAITVKTTSLASIEPGLTFDSWLSQGQTPRDALRLFSEESASLPTDASLPADSDSPLPAVRCADAPRPNGDSMGDGAPASPSHPSRWTSAPDPTVLGRREEPASFDTSAPPHLSFLTSWMEKAGVSCTHLSDGDLFVQMPLRFVASQATSSSTFVALPIRDPLLYPSVAGALLDAGVAAAPYSAIRDALVLSSRRSSGCPVAPHDFVRRVGFYENTLWIDLADAAGRFVAITASGWTVTEECPITFVRTASMQPLPLPAESGTLDQLRHLMGVSRGPDWVLLRGWLVGALMPFGPVPPLLLHHPNAFQATRQARLCSWILDPQSLSATGPSNSSGPPFISVSDASNRGLTPPHGLSGAAGPAPTLLKEASEAAVLHGGLHLPGDLPCGRLIFTDSARRIFPADLRRRALVLRANFRPPLAMGLPLSVQVSHAHGSILGALCTAASASLRGYRDAALSSYSAASAYAPFVRWATAAETAMPPAAVAFRDLWDEVTARAPRPVILWRRLRRRVERVVRFVSGWPSSRAATSES